MVDTVRTLSALQTLLADNTDQDISPQDIRDFLVSVFPPQFSGARLSNSGTQTNIDGAGNPVVVQFDTADFDTDSYFDDANNALVAPDDAFYLVNASSVLLDTANLEQGSARIHVNGASNQTIWYRRVLTNIEGDRIGFNGSTLVNLAANDAVTLTISTTVDGGANEVDISFGNNTILSIVRLGQAPA